VQGDVSEIRARVWTFESKIKDNNLKVESINHYKELVHGAWNEAIELKSDVSSVNNTLEETISKLEKESEERENTDNLLMELFQSVLTILSNDVTTIQNLEKSSKEVEGANVKILESKIRKEMASTRKLLDSHSSQLTNQKAQFLEYTKVEEQLNNIEFRLALEMAKSENLTRTIQGNHDLVGRFAKFDENILAPKTPKLNITEISSKISVMIEKLKTEIDVSIFNLTEKTEKNNNSTHNLSTEFAKIAENQTELWNQNEKLENKCLNISAEIYENKNVTDSEFGEVRFEIEELFNITKIQEESIANMSSQIFELEAQISNLTEHMFVIESEKSAENNDLILELQKTVAALKYGYDMPPEMGEILIAGGDGDFGAIWDTFLVSTEHKAKRLFSEMPLARTGHCLIKFENNIYAIGGAWDSVSVLNRRFEWKDIDPMLETRDSGPGCAVFNDRIWVCGGHDGYTELITCESFHPKDGWQFEADLLVEISQTTAVVNSAGLFMIGGTNSFGDSPFVQFYDAEVNLWRMWEDLPLHIADGRAITVDDQIYLVGGSGGNEQNILHLNMETQEWTLAAEFKSERVGAAVVAVGSEIWTFGGEFCFDQLECGNEIEVFDTLDFKMKKMRIKNLINVNYAAAILI
jgi:hypothetical protein